MRKPTVVILAGGKNSRFFPLNTGTHKGFINLLGKPLVIHMLESLREQSYRNFIIIVAPKDYNTKGFANYVKRLNIESKLRIKIKFILQEKPMGMGEALLLAKPFLKDYFIVATPYQFNFNYHFDKLLEKKVELKKADCILSATETHQPQLYGILQLDPGRETKVIGIVEKPLNLDNFETHYKVNSAYLFSFNFLQELEKTSQEDRSLETAITNYAKTHYISWIEHNDSNVSLKYSWHLFDVFKLLIKQEKKFISMGAKITDTTVIDAQNGPIIIESGVTIGDFVKIKGPCYIGKNVMIGDYAFIRESTIEAYATIGAKTEVVRSIVMKYASIHFSYLADSILGQNTKIGAGFISANKRFDRRTITTTINEQKVNTLATKLGIITGEDTTIGVQVTSMPGTLLREESLVYPHSNIDQETVKKINKHE